jgi:D-arabinose 5-phosphate isomerase GutQ
MHFLFTLLRINGFYMFRALLVHPQEALHKGTWYLEDEQVMLEISKGS